MNLQDRTCVITGCASGIGRHLAGALSRRGMRVLATDVDAAGLERAAAADAWEPARVQRTALDVRDATQWQAVLDEAVAQWGGLDVLFNVAGITYCAFAHELDPERVIATLDINTRGMIFGTRYAAAHMVARRAGHIVNFCSLAGLAPVYGLSTYSASKFGIRGFSLAAAEDLAPYGIAVTAVCPDAVDTPMLEAEALEASADMVFSGSRALTVHDIERAIVERVLPKRPLEVHLPAGRGMIARLATAFPAIANPLLPVFLRAGHKNRAAYLADLERRRR